jgi:hypothetical protein
MPGQNRNTISHGFADYLHPTGSPNTYPLREPLTDEEVRSAWQQAER